LVVGDTTPRARDVNPERAQSGLRSKSPGTRPCPWPKPTQAWGMPDTPASVARLGVLTISDRASRGDYEDLGGPAIITTYTAYLTSPWESVYRCIPDERPGIEATLIDLCDVEHCDLVVTTGGTGPSPRDVTPEATEAVCEKMMPGFGELMRTTSLKYVATAILSRQTAGIRGRTLIINLPGKPKSIRECLDAVFPAVPYCLDLIGAARLETNPEVINAFRPKGA
jgi:molybdopterin adenylyltransferase